MPSKIKPRRSYTANSVPLVADLEENEMAVNWTDGKIFVRQNNAIITLTLGGSGTSSDSRWDYFKPAAPTSVTASEGNAQATVSWETPAVIVPPVTDYTIQYSTNSGTSWTTFTRSASTATTATVTGLTNGSAAVFRVAAVNGIGTGAYSTASSAVTPIAGDPLFSSVSLLLHADGTGSTFVDNSPTPKTITAVGDATQSVAQSKWGGKSAYFDGSGDSLNTGATADTLLGQSGDFTVEMWIHPTSLSGTRALLSTRTNSSSNDVIIFGIRNSSIYIDTNAVGVVSEGTALTLNAWQHVAMTRSGNTFTTYLNGTVVATGSGSHSLSNSQAAIIGAEVRNDGGSAGQFAGYIDDVRITKGVARTITVPTAAFPDA